jgi:hypothetical protein
MRALDGLQAAGLLGLVVVSLAGQAAKPAPAPAPPAAAAPREPSRAELQAAIVRLQAQVLERDRELGQVKARLAEVELAALARAVETLDPEVRALLGVKPATPAAPAPAPPGASPPP